MDYKDNHLDSEISEVSTEQSSQESLIIIPDTVDSRNSFYSNDSDNNEHGRAVDFCKILPKLRNCKSTETSFQDYHISDNVSPNSSTLSKSLSETLNFCNKIIEPYQQPFTVHAESFNDRSENNVIVTNNYSDFTFPVRDGNWKPNSLTLRLCSNSIQDINESPGSNYQSTCASNKKEIGGTCTDKTKTEVCEGKSNRYAPKPCKIKDDSSTNLKRSCTNIPKVESKSSINTSREQDSKKNEEGRFSCLSSSADKCCPALLRMPPCKHPPPKKEPKKSCCSILENFKGSFTNIHKNSPYYSMQPQSSSNDENDTPASPAASKQEPISPERILSCTSTGEGSTKVCKNKPSYCTNTMIIETPDTNNPTHLSFLKLHKFPSRIKLENIQYEAAETLDQSLSDENLSGDNLFTESQRNFNTYFEFNKNNKPRNLSNCMKVKVIPSTTDLTQSEMSVTMMKVDHNETIPTCKITSEDFTTIAKDFFGNFYMKTKDAMTAITRESARHLQSIIHKTQSCNTDGTVPPLKVYKDESIDTSSSYAMVIKSCPRDMIDKGTSKREKVKRGKKIATQSSNSAAYCTCSKKYRSAVYATVATQEPPQQPNSVFTAIKSKLISIFREDDNLHSMYKTASSGSSDSSSDEYEDSKASVRTLPKRT